MGVAAAVVAGGVHWSAGAAVGAASSGGERDLVADADRRSVAGFARGVRVVEDRLRAAPDVVG